jgi:hypothetical protein
MCGKRFQNTHMFIFQVIKETGCVIGVLTFSSATNAHGRVIGPFVTVLPHDRPVFSVYV